MKTIKEFYKFLLSESKKLKVVKLKAYVKGAKSLQPQYKKKLAKLESILMIHPAHRSEHDEMVLSAQFNNHRLREGSGSTMKGKALFDKYRQTHDMFQCHLGGGSTGGRHVVVYATNNKEVVFILCGSHDDLSGD